MAKGRKLRQQRTTLLVVGEGATEAAFLSYLRRLYCSGNKGPKVTVRNAHGKGPEHVLDFARRAQRGVAFDYVVAFLDTDIPWTDALKKQAKQSKIELIGNTPCIEGLFLKMLGKPVPTLSAHCKKQLSVTLSYGLLAADEYEQWCSTELLTDCALTDKELSRLLSFYSAGC